MASLAKWLSVRLRTKWFWVRAPLQSLKQDHISFSVRRKYIMFSGKTNVIFPDDIRKIIFQCHFFGNATFSEHLMNISYFHVFFWERSSFIFRLKNKIIFLGKRNIIFRDDTRKIIFQCNFYGKIIFSEHLEKENNGFLCSACEQLRSKKGAHFAWSIQRDVNQGLRMKETIPCIC